MRSLRIVLLMLAIATAAAAAGMGGTLAAFKATASNGGNTISSATVLISDNDSGSALFSLSGMKPADAAVSRCIKVTYTGTAAAGVDIYRSSLGGALGPYLNLTVTRGTDAAPSFSSCAGFGADATDYIGAGPGVIYQGTLSGFNTSGAALVDPKSGAPETWTTNEAHSYKFTVSVAANDAAQGTSTSVDLTWRAANQ